MPQDDQKNPPRPSATRRATPFARVLRPLLEERSLRLEEVCPEDNIIAQRVLEEYGAMFVAGMSVRVPPVCVFGSEEEVLNFQKAATFRAESFGEASIELQPAALDALIDARVEARRQGFDITPRDGAEAARRSYADTLRLWNSRFFPALEHWQAQGRLSLAEVSRLRTLAPLAQVVEVLELEKDGIFFSKDFSKTVWQSVAAPGTSPHLSMYAFDVAEFRDEPVRRLLARHGWFQTVRSDLPHFTFLGLAETELPARGLRRVEASGQIFWIPETD